MTGRKSGRSRKSVDYKAFTCDDDSEDDFAECTPPVSKKRKVSADKENNQEKPQKIKKESKQPRKSVEEKLFEREIQAALELSLTQSGGESQDGEVAMATKEPPTLPPATEVANSEAPSPVLPVIDTPPVLPRVSDLTATCPDIEEINTMKHSAASKTKYVSSDSEPDDSDFAEDSSGEDSTDEFNEEDSDSDFGSSKKKSKVTSKSKPAKTQPHKTASTKKAAPNLTPKSVKVPTPGAKSGRPKPSVGTSGGRLTSPAVTRPVARVSGSSPASRTTPASRTPSASLGAGRHSTIKVLDTGRSPLGGVSIKSPSSGVLRLGLSRNIRLKPLHSNIKIHN